MKKYLAAAAILALAIVGCSNDPVAPSGSLPNVSNLRIDETASKGDSVFLIWDALDEDVDGYRIYFATTVPGNWVQPGVTSDTTWTHIALSTGYYELAAFKGVNTSSGFSNRVNSRAEETILERELRTDSTTNGLLFSANGTGWELGCADSADFAQDIYIGIADSKVYIYSGNHNPVQFPGGNDTKLCPLGCHGNVAPEHSSLEWVDSVQVTDFNWVFLQLDNNHYAEFYVDSVFTNGADLFSFEYQLIDYLRLFNVF
ncbi:MAG: hypothetical protein KAR44_10050 [Candidatus Aegiribacteria sp.]|nr:hypothetical protein [Candidatus Aegiribacteria sp.]